MSQRQLRDEAVDSLQELGLKEYQARCFVALTRLDAGTAKEISEISAVPRTRVYDAIENLEEAGVVFTQHGSPKRFPRSISERLPTPSVGRKTTGSIPWRRI